MVPASRILLGSLFLIGIPALAPTLMAPRSAVAAQQAGDPAQFVQELGNRAIAQLAGKQIPEAEERERFQKLLNEAFDLTTIGKFTVGRAYWSTATPQQQQEFLRLYANQVTNAYSKRFQDYSGEQFRVTGQKRQDDGDTVVTSEITQPSGGNPVPVEWRVRPQGGGLKIVDVVIAGISMAVTDRQQFAAVIERGGGGIQPLIDALRSQNLSVAQPPNARSD